MDSSLLRKPHSSFTLGRPILVRKCRRYSLSLPTNPRKLSFTLRSSSSGNDVGFDEAAYEAERLSLDAKARQTMAEEASKITEDPKAWKWVIRKRIWDMMEAQNIAQNPRPVHHRIPNFLGASAAADKVTTISLLFGF